MMKKSLSILLLAVLMTAIASFGFCEGNMQAQFNPNNYSLLKITDIFTNDDSEIDDNGDFLEMEASLSIQGTFGAIDAIESEPVITGFEDGETFTLTLAENCVLLMPSDVGNPTVNSSITDLQAWYDNAKVSLRLEAKPYVFYTRFEMNTEGELTRLEYFSPVTQSNEEADPFFQKVKAYVLNGQGDIPEATKLNWSPSFLEETDIQTVYQLYLADGGEPENINAFATYLTDHAIVPENWKELFEADLLNGYSQTVTKYELLEDELYQVYVTIDGSVVPYVVVNARTGWYHG